MIPGVETVRREYVRLGAPTWPFCADAFVARLRARRLTTSLLSTAVSVTNSAATTLPVPETTASTSRQQHWRQRVVVRAKASSATDGVFNDRLHLARRQRDDALLLVIDIGAFICHG
jgi:hypothetical protein